MKAKIILCFALLALTGVFAGIALASPDSDPANPLSLSIALLNSPFDSEIYVDIHPNSHFHVVITNDSKEPQNLLKEGSSWGWDTLSFELIDEKGNKYLIRRTPAIWTDNAPVYWIFKPGEHYVRDVCFGEIYQGENSWTGFPDLKYQGGTLKVKMKAIFEVTIDKGVLGAPLWHGHIESQPISCRIRDIRSERVDPSSSGE